MKNLVTAMFIATLLATGSALAQPAGSGDLCWTMTNAFGSGHWSRCRGASRSFVAPVCARRGHDRPNFDPLRQRGGADGDGVEAVATAARAATLSRRRYDCRRHRGFPGASHVGLTVIGACA